MKDTKLVTLLLRGEAVDFIIQALAYYGKNHPGNKRIQVKEIIAILSEET